MTFPHTRHPIVEIKCPGALTISFRSQQNTRACLASIELPQIQFLGNETVCFSKINADTHESHMEKSREPPKTKMLLYQLKWAVCLRKTAQVIIENQPQQRKKTHDRRRDSHQKSPRSKELVSTEDLSSYCWHIWPSCPVCTHRQASNLCPPSGWKL